MQLIKVENFELKVDDSALLIKPIRRLWNQDRSDRKEKFYEQMSYMYHVYSPASPYSYIVNEEERKQQVIEQENLPKNFKPSGFLEEAIEVYKKATVTPSQKLLESSLIAANNVSNFLRTLDLKEEDDKGRPKYQISQVTAALKNVDGIITSLQSLQKKVEQELQEQSSARGSQELTIGDLEYY